MKIVQSFWSKPSLDLNCTKVNGGWLERKHHYMSWALSCLQLRKFYDHVELFTDQQGKTLLIDILGLPYSDVKVELDTLNHYHAELWCIGKIYSYSKQTGPFIHVDGDFFSFSKFPRLIEQSGLVAQNNLYANKAIIQAIMRQINAIFVYVPEYLKKNMNSDTDPAYRLYNPGIFGGTDINFIQQYCQECFDFINQNNEMINRSIGYVERDALATFDTNYIDFFNSIVESCLFTTMTETHEMPVECLLEDSRLLTYQYSNLIESNKAFIHPIYHHKKHTSLCMELEYKLRQQHPDYYYKIMSALEEYQL